MFDEIDEIDLNLPAHQEAIAELAQKHLQKMTVQQRWALVEAIARTQVFNISIQEAQYESRTGHLFPPVAPELQHIVSGTLEPDEAENACSLILQSLRAASPTP